MRAGPNWAAQQTLTAEAAVVLRHSLALARRRRHAQLTPLHVAATLLSSKQSILARACLRCRSHNSMALELCLNVALNRIPATNSDNSVPLPFSNALVAVLKRAQAHQRRGCIENQQDGGLSIKVDVGRLVISVLDDPSVSRVMREVGLSSIAVREHVEEYCCSASDTASPVLPEEGHGILDPHSFSFHEFGIPVSFLKAPELVDITKKPLSKLDQDFVLSCCKECTSNYVREVHLLLKQQQPVWAHSKDEDLAELRKKWIRLCQTLHCDKLNPKPCNLATFHGTQIPYPHYQFWATHNSISFSNPPRNPNTNSTKKCSLEEPYLDFLKRSEGKEVSTTLRSGDSHYRDNLNLGENEIFSRADLLKNLQENVPWQSEKIESIVDALSRINNSTRRDAWVLIEGDDTVGKRRLGFAIGESFLGSVDLVIHFDFRARNYSAHDLLDEMHERRSRYTEKEKLAVVVIENVDLAGAEFVKFLEERFESGKFDKGSGEGNGVVFVLTRGDCGDGGRAALDERSVVRMVLKANEAVDHKRKSEGRVSNKIKKPRIGDKEDQDFFLGVVENGCIHSTRKDFSRQRTFNAIDLNVKANGEEEDHYEPESSSDLTQETGSRTFLDSIKDRFTFNRTQARDIEMKELVLSKLRGSFDEVYGHRNKVRFTVEDSVLEEIVESSAFAVNSLVDKWVRDILKTSLNIVRISGRCGESVRLCVGDKEDGDLRDGFLNSSLPMKISINFED